MGRVRPTLVACVVLLPLLGPAPTARAARTDRTVVDARGDVRDRAPAARRTSAIPRSAVDLHRVTYRVHDEHLRADVVIGDARGPARRKGPGAVSREQVSVVVRIGPKVLIARAVLGRRDVSLSYEADFVLTDRCLPDRDDDYDARRDVVRVSVSLACFDRFEQPLGVRVRSNARVVVGRRIAFDDASPVTRLRLG